MDFQHIIETVGRFVDFAGVAVMVIGAVVSVPVALRGYQPKRAVAAGEKITVYRAYRQLLGRSILLGLELLVAADIIRTVAVAPTFESVGVHRRDPDVPELLPRTGNHGALALAKGGNGRRGSGLSCPDGTDRVRRELGP